MANMSYCRFRNTLEDFRDCANHIGDVEDLSVEERRARMQLIEAAADMLEELGIDIDLGEHVSVEEFLTNELS